MRLLSSILSLALVAPVLGAQATPAPVNLQRVPEIAVSAVGETDVTPDRARVSIGVQTQAATAAEAASRNATLQQGVITAVKALGIPAERITTSGYNVYPEQTYDQATRRSRITGYNVQNTVVVDVWKVDQVGAVLDAALSKGANLVSSLSFYSSQEEAGRRRALQNAVARARADAEAMAQAAGGHLGDLLELTSGISYAQPPRPVFAGTMEAKMAVPTPVSEGTQTLSAQVTARWRFVAGQ
jgi:uncharacterized protein YggE